MRFITRITFTLLAVFCSLTVRAQQVTMEPPPVDFATLDAIAAENADPLDAVVAAVRRYDPQAKYENTLYALSTGNRLDAVLQTPNVWGKPPGSVDWGHSNPFADTIGNTIAEAQSAVDITTLWPAPDGYFAGTIQTGLKALARSGRPVTVRLLVGHYFPNNFDAKGYLATLRDAVKSIPNSRLTIYAAGARTNAASWNHSKIVAVDGRKAIVGGHNLWPLDYLGPRPVHDLSILVSGPAARSSHQFANALWRNVCEWNNKGLNPIYSYKWKSGSNDIVSDCVAELPLQAPAVTGTTRMFGAGRAAAGVVPDASLANPADVAILAAFAAAKRTIRISQQDLALANVFAPSLGGIALALARKVDVSIVLTTPFAKAGNGQLYSTGTTLLATRAAVAAALGLLGLNAQEVAERMTRFHLVSLKFTDANAWPNGWGFANHAKMFIIDDELFYVGSHNLYPTTLQEYGYFVGNAEATRAMVTQYWDPLWKWSNR